MSELTVGDLCARRIATACASTSVKTAAKSMHAFGDRLLLVTGDQPGGARHALGVVTDHELAATIAGERNPSELTLAEVMRPCPAFVSASDGILETALWMRHHGMREVIVHDQTGALLGVLGMERLIESLAADLDGLGQYGPGAGAAPHRRTAFH